MTRNFLDNRNKRRDYVWNVCVTERSIIHVYLWRMSRNGLSYFDSFISLKKIQMYDRNLLSVMNDLYFTSPRIFSSFIMQTMDLGSSDYNLPQIVGLNEVILVCDYSPCRSNLKTMKQEIPRLDLAAPIKIIWAKMQDPSEIAN